MQTQPHDGAAVALIPPGMADNHLTEETLRALGATERLVRWFSQRFTQCAAPPTFADVQLALVQDGRPEDVVWLAGIRADLLCGPAEAPTSALANEATAGDSDRQAVPCPLQALRDSMAEQTLRDLADQDYRHVATVEFKTHAGTRGHGAAAAALGTGANAATFGNEAAVAALGEDGRAWSHGDKAPAAALAKGGIAQTTGAASPAGSFGYHGESIANGDASHAMSLGNGGRSTARGRWAHAAALGDLSIAEVEGPGAAAVVMGQGGKARAGVDGAIVLVRPSGCFSGPPRVFASLVGENGIKPNTWYTLDAQGKPVEVR